MIEWILFIFALVWLGFASIIDLKTREVPDWLSYTLIGGGLGLRLLYSLQSYDWQFFISGLLGFSIFFFVALGMYYTKQWGGGDAKLLMGMGAVFGLGLSLFEDTVWPLPLTLLFHILIAGAVYGIIYGLVLAGIHYKRVLHAYAHTSLRSLFFFSFAALSLFILGFFFDDFIQFALFTGSVTLFVLFHLLFLFKILEKEVMEKDISVERLTEGDWLVHDVIVRGKVICPSKGLGLTKQQLLTLKEHKIKTVRVKEGIPFVPGLFFSVLLTFYAGNAFYFFL